MTVASLSLGLDQLREMHKRAEQARGEAAETERAAFVDWQEAYGAYEIARDEASTAWMAFLAAITP